MGGSLSLPEDLVIFAQDAKESVLQSNSNVCCMCVWDGRAYAIDNIVGAGHDEDT